LPVDPCSHGVNNKGSLFVPVVGIILYDNLAYLSLVDCNRAEKWFQVSRTKLAATAAVRVRVRAVNGATACVHDETRHYDHSGCGSDHHCSTKPKKPAVLVLLFRWVDAVGVEAAFDGMIVVLVVVVVGV